ncbi:tRNA1(Val) (adenine(37)-N6)-methyltransferase [Clostridium sp. 'deep sea']|uniref:tRNA1(Val) (adenine(37)-N6)-methyltransferase n=1 Tax=Clostridium sp. 'deep sea' TaxID=2779445 RepID=UPI0018963ED1|nr:tRNA1(Val) (adenine(37)-N6)-methyltransferase [Clostridium sp. 'deep sea']QOR34498.1 tRNA1(Val) (adenine(37)-N6)-methyltransferase [Clostridium sp. 'deep sea']
MERIDNLMHTGLNIIQDDKYFSFGIDAVLLSMFVRLKRGDKVVDFGTGVGVIPLMLSTRQTHLKIKALEIQPEVAALALRNVELNNLSQTIDIVNEDLKNSVLLYGHEKFDVVVSNPPYMPLGVGDISPQNSYAIARHEVHCTLSDVVKASKAVVKYGGKVNFVYKSSRLVELITMLREHKLEPKRLQLVQSRQNSESHIFLVEAVKGAKSGIKILPTLVIYDDGENYTDQMKKLCFSEDKNE